MLSELDLEKYNQRFRDTLVGKWIALNGTFFLMSEAFEFFANGKGVWTKSSGSGEYKTFFDWKIEAPFVLQILETIIEDDAAELGTANIEQEEVSQWYTFEYAFKLIAHDCGEEIALCKKHCNYFYYSNAMFGLVK